MNGCPHLFSFVLPFPPSLLILDCSCPRSFSCSYVIPTTTLYPGPLYLSLERFHRRRFLGTRRCRCPCIASSLLRRSARSAFSAPRERVLTSVLLFPRRPTRLHSRGDLFCRDLPFCIVFCNSIRDLLPPFPLSRF